ncbi:phosphotransferase [Kitasatospora sp. NPDC088160]|uniref:phosphotransferase n=1 Tax=Kitasatospora sp. NPDC088160 TaxID=3364072 RepID=UPI0037FDE0E6
MTPEESRRIVYGAARAQGLDPTGAQPLQPEHDHVYRLPHAGAVAKVHGPSTSRRDALRQRRAARWLRSKGIATPRPAGIHVNPIQCDSPLGPLQVTFADDLGDTPTTPGQLGALLRKLHSLDSPDFELPVFDPFKRVADRIEALPAAVLPSRERTRLHRFLATARTAWQALEWPDHGGLLHGDVGPATSILAPSGAPTLIDLETLSVGGPCLWDAAAISWRRDVFGAPSREHAEFTAEYGIDASRYDGGRPYEVMSRIFALRGYLTAAEYALTEPDRQSQADLRHSSVADPLPPFPWNWSLDSRLPEPKPAP